jgi:hypothetical protein
MEFDCRQATRRAIAAIDMTNAEVQKSASRLRGLKRSLERSRQETAELKASLTATMNALDSLSRAIAAILDRDTLLSVNNRLQEMGAPTLGRLARALRAYGVYEQTPEGRVGWAMEAQVRAAPLDAMPVESMFTLPALPHDPPETEEWLAGRITTEEWLGWARVEKARWLDCLRRRRAARLLADRVETSLGVAM